MYIINSIENLANKHDQKYIIELILKKHTNFINSTMILNRIENIVENFQDETKKCKFAKKIFDKYENYVNYETLKIINTIDAKNVKHEDDKRRVREYLEYLPKRYIFPKIEQYFNDGDLEGFRQSLSNVDNDYVIYNTILSKDCIADECARNIIANKIGRIIFKYNDQEAINKLLFFNTLKSEKDISKYFDEKYNADPEYFNDIDFLKNLLELVSLIPEKRAKDYIFTNCICKFKEFYNNEQKRELIFNFIANNYYIENNFPVFQGQTMFCNFLEALSKQNVYISKNEIDYVENFVSNLSAIRLDKINFNINKMRLLFLSYLTELMKNDGEIYREYIDFANDYEKFITNNIEFYNNQLYTIENITTILCDRNLQLDSYEEVIEKIKVMLSELLETYRNNSNNAKRIFDYEPFLKVYYNDSKDSNLCLEDKKSISELKKMYSYGIDISKLLYRPLVNFYNILHTDEEREECKNLIIDLMKINQIDPERNIIDLSKFNFDIEDCLKLIKISPIITDQRCYDIINLLYNNNRNANIEREEALQYVIKDIINGYKNNNADNIEYKYIIEKLSDLGNGDFIKKNIKDIAQFANSIKFEQFNELEIRDLKSMIRNCYLFTNVIVLIPYNYNNNNELEKAKAIAKTILECRWAHDDILDSIFDIIQDEAIPERIKHERLFKLFISFTELQKKKLHDIFIVDLDKGNLYIERASYYNINNSLTHDTLSNIINRATGTSIGTLLKDLALEINIVKCCDIYVNADQMQSRPLSSITGYIYDNILYEHENAQNLQILFNEFDEINAERKRILYLREHINEFNDIIRNDFIRPNQELLRSHDIIENNRRIIDASLKRNTNSLLDKKNQILKEFGTKEAQESNLEFLASFYETRYKIVGEKNCCLLRQLIDRTTNIGGSNINIGTSIYKRLLELKNENRQDNNDNMQEHI